MAEARARRHGRRADRPQRIPKPGWRDILLRTKDEIAEDQISLVAAGVAFYGLLALFPAIAAGVSIYGLVADPAQVQQNVAMLEQVLPAQASAIINQQLQRIASGSTGALSVGLAFSVIIALWSATAGTKALMSALTVVYDEEESRSFLRFNLFALGLTLVVILYGLIAFALLAALPAALGMMGLPHWVDVAASWLRWPLLALVVIFGLSVLYRYAPDRHHARWRWVSWGAVAATVLWLMGSALFSVYVANFGSYNETYGSIGAVVVLLLWFDLSAFIFLGGAELNAEMEHQTNRDTTVGGDQPRGQRQAYVADDVGRVPPSKTGSSSR
jgi:membrane protein